MRVDGGKWWGSEDSDLSFFYVPDGLFRDVYEVEGAVSCHHSQPFVFLVEANLFVLFVGFDFGYAPLGVKELVYNFEESHLWLFVFSLQITVLCILREAILLSLNTFFYTLRKLKNVNRWFLTGACN